MRQRPVTIFWIVAVATGLAALVIADLAGGRSGLAGMSLGLSGSTFNLWALSAIISLSSGYTATEVTRRKGTLLVVLAFFLKLPLFIAFGIIAHRVGGAAPTCFLLGIALVYLALVGWSLARR